MALTVAVMEVKQGVNYYMFLQHHLIAFGHYTISRKYSSAEKFAIFATLGS